MGSLLSNKNLWSGLECGRSECKPCKQPGDKKEPCTTKNIVYESECSKCNPEGTRRVADRSGLAEKGDKPSLYVGESSRSLKERAGEHWADAEGWKEECHMVEHQMMAHKGEENPAFQFRVVKKCGSSLERQVREAVRIQMRGLVLNKKGTYNRCKLTRLVVDSEWDDKVWKESWTQGVGEDQGGEKEWEEWEGEECLAMPSKSKRPREDAHTAKRAKLDTTSSWGESIPVGVAARTEFLHSSNQEMGVDASGKSQTKIKVYCGLEWLCLELVREIANTAASLACLMEGVANWEEWNGEECVKVSKRSEREERYLWQRLKEIDSELAREGKRVIKKKEKVVATARRKMGVSVKQPSILESLRVVKNNSRPKMEGSGSVNTLTGSVSVADSQSNTVTTEASLELLIPENWRN